MKISQDSYIVKAFLSCRDGLVRSILKMSVHPADVDDILQETFLRVLNANEKGHIQSPQDYLFVVSRNLVIERLTRRSREIITEIDEAQVGADEVSAERRLHYQKKFEKFNEALRALPENSRRAILLRKFYGFTHREIAKKMGVSVSSVEKYIASGMKQCRRALVTQGYDFAAHQERQQAGRGGAARGVDKDIEL